MVVNDYIPYTKYIKNNSWENFPTRLFILSFLSIVLPLFSCIARPLLSSSKLWLSFKIQKKQAVLPWLTTIALQVMNSSPFATQYPPNCLYQQFSNLRAVCLTVSELVNFVSVFMYLWILHIWNIHTAIIFSSYFVVDYEQKWLLENYWIKVVELWLDKLDRFLWPCYMS